MNITIHFYVRDERHKSHRILQSQESGLFYIIFIEVEDREDDADAGCA